MHYVLFKTREEVLAGPLSGGAPPAEIGVQRHSPHFSMFCRYGYTASLCFIYLWPDFFFFFLNCDKISHRNLRMDVFVTSLVYDITWKADQKLHVL